MSDDRRRRIYLPARRAREDRKEIHRARPAAQSRRGPSIRARGGAPALVEIARIAEQRAVLHQALAQRHAAFWLGDWERQKMQRLHELASILADPEFAAIVRGHDGLRALFATNTSPPLPRRPRSPNKRKSRAKWAEDGEYAAPLSAFDLGIDWPKL